METKAIPDYPRGVTFEQVWAILQEVSQSQKETDRLMKETSRKMEETDLQIEKTSRQMEETDRQVKETSRQIKETDRQMKETDRQMKNYDKRFGDFTNRLGEVVEHMIKPNLRKKFSELGYDFQIANSNTEISDFKNNIHLEVDVMLGNGDIAILVEIKTKLTISDVKEHIKRLEKMRTYANLRGDKRVFLGAVAGVVIPKNVKKYAIDQGFFLVKPSGETFNITPPSDKPKEW